MTLHAYASECRGLAQELATALDAADVEALRSDLAVLGMDGWLYWLHDHAEVVAAFVAAAPAARSKRAGWQREHLRLTWAAYQHCIRAAELLETASSLVVGCSYRQMAATAGTLAAQLDQGGDWPDWPWEDPDPQDDW